MSVYRTLYISTAICVGLSACGGGSGGGASFDAQNAGYSCDERTFLGDESGFPAIYFNGQIPVSSQVSQGSFTTDNVYVHDFEARTITINETNSAGAGRTTTVYSLDDSGRPARRTTQVVNFAIQLNSFLPELRYFYDDEGLVSSYTLHSVVDDQPVEQPYNTVSLTWTDIAGIETSISPAIDGLLSGSTFTYEYDCTTLLSVREEFFETPSSPAVIRNSSVVTSGSGKAVTTVTTLEGSGSSGRRLVFDSFGNLMQVGDETINYEPSSERVINIELFENALRYRGLI